MHNMDFTKGRGTRDEIGNIHWIIVKAREFQKKKIYFCFIDYAKTFNCVNHNKIWKVFKEVVISNHHTCLLRNLYENQEETEQDMEKLTHSKLGKGVQQSYILSLCLFNLNVDYFM